MNEIEKKEIDNEIARLLEKRTQMEIQPPVQQTQKPTNEDPAKRLLEILQNQGQGPAQATSLGATQNKGDEIITKKDFAQYLTTYLTKIRSLCILSISMPLLTLFLGMFIFFDTPRLFIGAILTIYCLFIGWIYIKNNREIFYLKNTYGVTIKPSFTEKMAMKQQRGTQYQNQNRRF